MQRIAISMLSMQSMLAITRYWLLTGVLIPMPGVLTLFARDCLSYPMRLSDIF